MAWAFVAFMTGIVLIGALSIVRKRETTEDYLVASRAVRPWLSALSAVGTNNSGFMFIGMIGYSYRLGVESVWMMVGWIVGDLLGWLFVHPRVRRASERHACETLSELIGTRARHESRPLIVASGLVTVLFLGVYAGAQLKAGSTALHSLFGWDMTVGALIGAVIVVLYSFAGGIRADIWTDAAQSAVMFVSMLLILVASGLEVGGPDALLANLGEQDPKLVRWLPTEARFGMLLYLLGFTFGGLGSVGQPHLMTRFMAIESVEAVKRARTWYFLWYVPFFVLSIGVGLYCRALIPDLLELPVAQDLRQPTELALPLLTMRVLPSLFVGVALAGLFAATVSTADSQIIVCSGAVTHDIHPRWKRSYLAQKLGTFGVTGLALYVALFAHEGVFGLVLVAWSAMGASLGPVLVLRLLDRPCSDATAMAMMIAGIVTVAWWHGSGLDDDVFKALPGAVAAFVTYGLGRSLERLRGLSRAG